MRRLTVKHNAGGLHAVHLLAAARPTEWETAFPAQLQRSSCCWPGHQEHSCKPEMAPCLCLQEHLHKHLHLTCIMRCCRELPNKVETTKGRTGFKVSPCFTTPGCVRQAGCRQLLFLIGAPQCRL